MTAGDPRTPFSLRPASQPDVPTLLQIFTAGFASDRVTRFKAHAHGWAPDYVPSLMREPLHAWLQRPERYRVLKAVERESGEVVGWVCWGFHGFEELGTLGSSSAEDQGGDGTRETSRDAHEPSQPASSEQRAPGSAPETLVDSDAQDTATTTLHPAQPGSDSGISRLESRCSASMHYWQTRLMPPGQKAMFIGAICVSPAFQSRGIGAALVHWGAERADAEGVAAWVHASEAGRGVFARAGFEEVGRLELDLDGFVDGREEGDGMDAAGDGDEDGIGRIGNGGWGRYTFRYMVRQPARS